MEPDNYRTDKIGFASYLCFKGIQLVDVHVKNRNRSTFTFDLSTAAATQLELEYTRSDFARYFESFKYLRERTIRGA